MQACAGRRCAWPCSSDLQVLIRPSAGWGQASSPRAVSWAKGSRWAWGRRGSGEQASATGLLLPDYSVPAAVPCLNQFTLEVLGFVRRLLAVHRVHLPQPQFHTHMVLAGPSAASLTDRQLGRVYMRAAETCRREEARLHAVPLACGGSSTLAPSGGGCVSVAARSL